MNRSLLSSGTRFFTAGFVLANLVALGCSSSDTSDGGDNLSGAGGQGGSATLGKGGSGQAGTAAGGKSSAGASGTGASGGSAGSVGSGGAAGSSAGSGGSGAGSGGSAAGGAAGTATSGAGGDGSGGAAGSGGSAGSAGGGDSGSLCGGKAGGARMERVNRGVVAVRTNGGNYVSWRLLGFEAADTGFHVYRDGTQVTDTPITNSTNYVDAGGGADAEYSVRAVTNGVEAEASETASTWAEQFLEIPLQIPAGGMTPSGEAYTYSASDASIGDVDGDGQYEIILKWEPSNAKDNSQSGYTGNVFLDAYRLDGMRLWRIDLGRNIRAGAHYTQFMVYDFDGDGRAEIACKTSDGTKDGTGKLVAPAGETADGDADYRNSGGYILTGNEWLTLFNGLTGAELVTVDYVPGRGNVNSWGDDYGNRVDRFLAGVAYLDGERPSLISARGYYTRTVIVAWDYRDGELTRRWTFDDNDDYAGQGDHSLSIADVDADGKQEIIYGAMTVDDDGTGLYTTGLGHGDALHVSDFDPSRPGLEVFNIQERVDDAGSNFRDARTGQVLWRKATSGDEGPGRGAAADIFAGNPGAEMWSAGGGISGLFNVAGTNIGRAPSSCNFLVWWDADPLRELLDANRIDKYGMSSDTRLLTAADCSSNNGSKSTPTLSGDILGDWREEVIWRRTDNTALRLYTTTAVTDRRIFTLLHDPQYRVALAWQNVAYNQPPHPSFAIGDGVGDPPPPNITVPCP